MPRRGHTGSKVRKNGKRSGGGGWGRRSREELLAVAGARAGVNLPSLLFEAVEPLSWQYMITHSLARTEHITYGRWRTLCVLCARWCAWVRVCGCEKLRFVMFLLGRSGPASTTFTFLVSGTLAAAYDTFPTNRSPWKTHHRLLREPCAAMVRATDISGAPLVKPCVKRFTRLHSAQRIANNLCDRNASLSRLPGYTVSARAHHHYLE